ncbi:Protein of unknown function, partial [Cotesia congregata]
MKKFQLYSRSSQYRILKNSQERDDSSSDEEVDRINSKRGQPREINQNCRPTRSFNNTNCNRSDENENDESLSEEDANNVLHSINDKIYLDDDNIDHGFEEAENIRNNRDINDEEIYETDSDDDSESSREFDGSSSSEESSASENDTDSDDDMENGLPNNNENLDSPLYESAPLSCGESILSILLLIIRHKLSSVVLKDILKIIRIHCSLPNLCIKSLYKFKKIFSSIPGHQNPVKIRGMIICGTCDLPAKAGFLNMKGHRGIYGCCKCKIKSEKLGNFRIFPYSNALPLRSSAITTQEGQRAFLSGKPIDGVKGPTTLSKIAYNFVENTVVDSMHCIYLGITKKLMSLWFDSKYHSENFSMRDHIAAIDKKIKSIKPPNFSVRLPRSVSDFKYWKASELQCWLLYYSVAVLDSIMSKAHYDHHMLLVLGVSLLNQSSVSQGMIQLASKVLNEYVSKFENLYDRKYLTCNLHQLLHLPDDVMNFGPLFITSCFPFENLNGILKRCYCKDSCENCEKNSSYYAIINECTVDNAVISNEHLNIGSIGRRSDKAMIAVEISKLEL